MCLRYLSCLLCHTIHRKYIMHSVRLSICETQLCHLCGGYPSPQPYSGSWLCTQSCLSVCLYALVSLCNNFLSARYAKTTLWPLAYLWQTLHTTLEIINFWCIHLHDGWLSAVLISIIANVFPQKSIHTYVYSLRLHLFPLPLISTSPSSLLLTVLAYLISSNAKMRNKFTMFKPTWYNVWTRLTLHQATWRDCRSTYRRPMCSSRVVSSGDGRSTSADVASRLIPSRRAECVEQA